jgi:hypothetical protein
MWDQDGAGHHGHACPERDGSEKPVSHSPYGPEVVSERRGQSRILGMQLDLDPVQRLLFVMRQNHSRAPMPVSKTVCGVPLGCSLARPHVHASTVQ